MGKLPKFYDENLLVGIETSDDAAIYKITDDVALIQTVDFFTPIVDDPYTFGQIAAANSLSDVYAMGGEPKIALNIVGFPNCLDPSILGDILAGGADKVKEAGAVLVGGHSVQDDEPKYGLCVSGFVHPKKIFKNYGCKPGDILILTKQIGTGIINTAIKAEMASKRAIDEAVCVMSSLNKKAKEVISNYPIHACTDITGFGLLGHCVEMAEASHVSFELDTDSIAYLDDSIEYAQMGLVPAGAYNNRGYSENKVDFHQVEEHFIDLLYDPQTSGGLLISVAPEHVSKLMEDFKFKELDTKVSIIGQVVEEEEKLIKLY
ncbi:Selenide,water dikinase selenocysteine-containing [Lachnospiraceae bacterium TWA4]|nr:Selenide,water dikinase selenocysteine-containing [Lachnospiraceae bacterium TWA4]